MQLNIIDLDVWGNKEEGYEINNFHSIGKIEVDDDQNLLSEEKLRSLLVEHGFIRPSAVSKIDLEDLAYVDFFYQVVEKNTGRPIYNIELVKED